MPDILKPQRALSRSVAEKIKAARRDAGLSQTQLAEAVGVTYQQFQKYENDKNRVSLDRLQRIANAVNRPITYFLAEPGVLSADEDVIVSRLVAWLGQNREAPRLLRELPSLDEADTAAVAQIVERLRRKSEV